MATHTPNTANTLPTWVFIPRVAGGDYRHEIRRVPRGYMVFSTSARPRAAVVPLSPYTPHIGQPLKCWADAAQGLNLWSASTAQAVLIRSNYSTQF